MQDTWKNLFKNSCQYIGVLLYLAHPFLEKKTNTSDVRDNLPIKASAKQLQMETLFLQSLSCQKLMS